MRPDGSATVDRLSYPDGAHDAEALLLAPDGTPYLVTKEIAGLSGVYRPAYPPAPGRTAALAKVATVRMTPTGTPGGPAGTVGQLLVTGGAVSRDGKLVALRTYTDAYVWPLTGSDVVGALAGAPRRVALPPEPQGEAISFTEDGASLVVAGETVPSDVDMVPVPAATAASSAAGAATANAAGGSAGLPTLNAALIAAGVATVAVWLTGLSPTASASRHRPTLTGRLAPAAGRSDPAQHADHPAEDGRVVTRDGLVRGVVRHQPDVAVAALVGLHRRLAVDHRGDDLAVARRAAAGG